MADLNPVERRFTLAHEDWLRFAADKPARMLYWRADDDDRQLVDLYLQVREERACTVIRLSHPFRQADTWFRESSLAIASFYEAHRQGALPQGIRADWQAPAGSPVDTVGCFYRTARSLMQHHPDIFPGLVFIIRPSHIDSPREFESALIRLLSHPVMVTAGEHRIRFVVPESAHFPATAALLRQCSSQVRCITGRYRMHRLPGEVVADSGERGPSGEFRRLFVLLGDTLRNDDTAQMATLRRQLLDMARAQGWPEQAAVIYLTTGVASLKSGNTALALKEYQRAREAGHQALAQGRPGGRKLIVSALFGEAGVLMKDNALLKAAACYQVAAEQAQLESDGILATEGWRMRAFCLDKAGQQSMALDSAMAGLDAAMLMAPDIRRASGLPRLVKWVSERTPAFGHRRHLLQQKLNQLFRERPQAAVSPDAPGRQLNGEE